MVSLSRDDARAPSRGALAGARAERHVPTGFASRAQLQLAPHRESQRLGRADDDDHSPRFGGKEGRNTLESRQRLDAAVATRRAKTSAWQSRTTSPRASAATRAASQNCVPQPQEISSSSPAPSTATNAASTVVDAPAPRKTVSQSRNVQVELIFQYSSLQSTDSFSRELEPHSCTYLTCEQRTPTPGSISREHTRSIGATAARYVSTASDATRSASSHVEERAFSDDRRLALIKTRNYSSFTRPSPFWIEIFSQKQIPEVLFQ